MPGVYHWLHCKERCTVIREFYSNPDSRVSSSGETARFVLPDKSVIDDVFQYTLYDYRQYRIDTTASEQGRFPSVMVVNWLQQKGRPKDESKDTSSQTSEGESKDDESQKIP